MIRIFDNFFSQVIMREKSTSPIRGVIHVTAAETRTRGKRLPQQSERSKQLNETLGNNCQAFKALTSSVIAAKTKIR